MIKVPAGATPPRPSSQGGPRIDIKNTTAIKCEKCDSEIFIPAFYMRKLSALMNPEGQDAVIPVQTFVCGACGNINDEFIPVFMKAETELAQASSPEPSQLVKP